MQQLKVKDVEEVIKYIFPWTMLLEGELPSQNNKTVDTDKHIGEEIA